MSSFYAIFTNSLGLCLLLSLLQPEGAETINCFDDLLAEMMPSAVNGYSVTGAGAK